MRHQRWLRDGHGHDKPPGLFAAVNDATKPSGRNDLSDHGLTRIDEAALAKGRRNGPPDIGLLGELKATLTRIELRQTVHEQVARQIVDMLAIHNEKLDAILEAATREPGPSPVLGVLAEILESLREQESLLAELPGILAETISDGWEREPDVDGEREVAGPAMEPTGSVRFDDRTDERP
jgi:hypothetical protein